jgi:hypothetical protein
MATIAALDWFIQNMEEWYRSGPKLTWPSPSCALCFLPRRADGAPPSLSTVNQWDGHGIEKVFKPHHIQRDKEGGSGLKQLQDSEPTDLKVRRMPKHRARCGLSLQREFRPH